MPPGWRVRERIGNPCPTGGRKNHTRRRLAPPRGAGTVPIRPTGGRRNDADHKEVGPHARADSPSCHVPGCRSRALRLWRRRHGDDAGTGAATATAASSGAGAPEPPAPEAPATPTGLHVDETTETTIEYHWNAVEGAIGYAVQISMDEMFGADDQIVPTVETHYRGRAAPAHDQRLCPGGRRRRDARGAGPERLVHARDGHDRHAAAASAAAGSGPRSSSMFSLSEDAKPAWFRTTTTIEAAMADVNSEMMVESNTHGGHHADVRGRRHRGQRGRA